MQPPDAHCRMVSPELAYIHGGRGSDLKKREEGRGERTTLPQAPQLLGSLWRSGKTVEVVTVVVVVIGVVKAVAIA